MENKIIKQGGITYYVRGGYQCYNIDIEPWVTCMQFIAGEPGDDMDYLLRDVMKQFTNVTSLVIDAGVGDIEISNFMFPNVKLVQSNCWRYKSGKYLIRSSTLLNTFCLDEEDVIDMEGIDSIGVYALVGCRTLNVINVDGVSNYTSYASFTGSMFMIKPLTDNRMRLIGKIALNTCTESDTIIVPDDMECVSDIYITDTELADNEPTINIRRGIDFQEKKTVVFHKFESMKAITMKTKDIKKIELLDVGVSCEQLIRFSQDIGYKLDSFVLTERHDKLKTYNGMLCSKNGKIVFGYMTDNIKDLMIPEGVECIKPGVFAHSKVESVTFPDSLVELESNAFSRCKNLKHIEFGNGIKSVGTKFYSHIFSGCSSLKSVIFPSQVEEIGECTFVYCDKLSEIHFGKNLKYIDNYAFALCPAMKNIVLPEKISLVGVRAFDSVCKITIDDKTETLPYHLAQSFILQADISDVLSHSTTDLLQTVSVSYHDRTVIVPRYVKRQYYHEIDKNFQKMLTNDYSFFRFGTCLEQKAMTALRDLIENDSEESRRHLKRVGGKFAKVVLKSGCNDDIVVQMVKLKLFSIKTLNSLLEIAQEQNRTVLISYILAELKTNTKSFTL